MRSVIRPPTTVPARAPNRMSTPARPAPPPLPRLGVALEERGRPEAEPGQGAGGDRRSDHQGSEGRHRRGDAHVAEHGAAEPGAPWPADRRLATAPVALAAARLGEAPDAGREQRARHAHDEERPTPPERAADHAAEHGAQRRTHEGQDPVVGVRPSPPRDRVVVGEQRLRGRVVDRLADTERGPHREELPVAADDASSARRSRPTTPSPRR